MMGRRRTPDRRTQIGSRSTKPGARTHWRDGGPWENGYVESFNGTLRDELLDREIFHALMEPTILIERDRLRCRRTMAQRR